jgi:ATP-dependent protease ClpP protease subunit
MFNLSKHIICFLFIFSNINRCDGFNSLNSLVSRREFLSGSLMYANLNIQNDGVNEEEDSDSNTKEESIIRQHFVNENIEDDNDEDEDGKLNNYKNNIYFVGHLDESTTFGITEALLANKKQILFDKSERVDPHINLYIQSPGGSLLPTLALVDEIKNLEIPVYTYVRGYAASAATLLSISGAKRYIYKHSVMMVHGIKFSEDANVGTLLEVKDMNSNVDLFTSIIKDIYKENTNLTDKMLDEIFIHDKWINSAQALKYGLVDELI